MKKISILLFFLAIACLAHSQSRPEFGFLLKAGNYAFPSSDKTFSSNYRVRQTTTTHLFAGQLLSIGIWQSIPLSNHFSLSTELLYRSAFIRGEERYLGDYFDGQFFHHFEDLRSQNIQESSLSLPIQVHYSFKKSGKLSMAVGTGFSHGFSANLTNGGDYILEKEAGWKDFGTTMNWNLGFHYRIDPKTALGIAFIHEQKSTNDRWLRYGCDCFCECSEFRDNLRPKLNSFSIVLKHNMLKN